MSKLDNTSTEELGIDVLNPIFGYSKTLSPLLKKRDKYPIWDGSLMLYEPDGKNNNDYLIGPIPVQVKSKCNTNIPRQAIKHSIKLEELNAFLKNGGVAYFVVYVHPTTYANSKVFYTLLAPVDLIRYKTEINGRKTIAIELKELPQMDSQLELDFKDFYNDCHKQYNHTTPIYLKDIKQDIDTFNLSLSTTNKGNEVGFFKHITSRDNFIYVTFKGDPTKTQHPLGDRRYRLKAATEIDLNITVANKIFFNKCTLEIANGETYLIINGVMKFPFPMELTEQFKGNIQIHTEFKSLNQQIHILEFLIAIIKEKCFYVGTYKMDVDNFGENDLPILQNELNGAQNLKLILDKLNVKEDLDISNISDHDKKNINTLIEHFIYHKDISPNNSKLPCFVKMDIANISILFLADKDKYGKIRLNNAFNLNAFAFSTDIDNKQKMLVPSYMAYRADYFRDATNINYDEIVDKFKEYQTECIKYYQEANWTLLHMLMAYDEQKVKNATLLNTALQLAEWLEKEDPDKNSACIHVINRLQTIKRVRPLNSNEQSILMNYIDANDSSDELKFASYLLIGETGMAKRYFAKLDSGTKNQYQKELPLYNLLKDEQ